MKKAFTFIELIFIIVILSILAVIAIPKLNATRDDAEITKSAINLISVVNDCASYYSSKGEFANLQTMTNAPLDSDGNYYIRDDKCVRFLLDDFYVKIEKVGTSNICNNLLNFPSVVSTFTGKSDLNGSSITDISKSDIIYIQIGGSNVKF